MRPSHEKTLAQEATRLARNDALSVRWSDEDQVFVGSIPGLVGECCDGETPEEVIPQLRDIAEDLGIYLSDKGESRRHSSALGPRGPSLGVIVAHFTSSAIFLAG
jgi:predicted RNase H-like HicB family nuclease